MNLITSFATAVFKWLLVLWTDSLLCRIEYFELELVHDKRNDNL